MSKISAVINVVEEELDTLPRAIESVKNLVDEVVVVDMSASGVSGDKKTKVFKHKLVNYVEPARNFGIEKAHGEWVLVLDPDEEIPGSLSREIQKVTKESGIDFFRLPRKNIIFGKWIKHSRWWPDYNVRLFKKGNVSWSEEIHGAPVTIGVSRNIPPEEKFSIKHNNYTSVEQYISRMNRYTTVQAGDVVKGGYKFNWTDLAAKPAGEFLSRYFAGEGYKDGVHGLALAGLQAVSEFVLYLKTWNMKEENLEVKGVIGEMRKIEREFYYWQADASGGLLGKIRKKFRF